MTNCVHDCPQRHLLRSPSSSLNGAASFVAVVAAAAPAQMDWCCVAKRFVASASVVDAAVAGVVAVAAVEYYWKTNLWTKHSEHSAGTAGIRNSMMAV